MGGKKNNTGRSSVSYTFVISVTDIHRNGLFRTCPLPPNQQSGGIFCAGLVYNDLAENCASFRPIDYKVITS